MRYLRYIIVVVLILLLALTALFIFKNFEKNQISETVTSFSDPTPTPFTTFSKPILPKSNRYDIYLIGDSMTHAFGPRGGIFSDLLAREYPGTFFEVSNYAEANQSILLLPERLNEKVQADHDLILEPIMKGNPDPDLIIIESFGYNPLSQMGTENGLKKQTEILTQVMTTLTNRYPNAVIMFLATIAPDKNTYGMSVTDSDLAGRIQEAEERMDYIENHMDYAKEHNIPLIDVYTRSLDSQGDGDTIYINPDDDIHPSAEGLAFIARIMVGKIREESIFP